MSDLARLSGSIRRAADDAIASLPRVAVAYSGGLDSTLLAVIAKGETAVTCYTACTRGSFDWANAPSQAAADGLEVRLVELSPERVRRLAGLVARTFTTNDPTLVGYMTPLFAVIEASEESTILVGSGADELFAGYAKYESEENLASLMEFDLEKALSELRTLQVYAKSKHKRVVAPFASDEVIKEGRMLPISRKITSEGRKLILRDLARSLGITRHDLPKKAAQYSSGVAKTIERLAKQNGCTQMAWVEKLRAAGTSESSNR